MNTIKFVLSILYTFFVGISMLHAQVSEGGRPASFDCPQTTRSAATPLQIPVNFSVEDLKTVNAWRVSNGAPLAVATLIDVNLDMADAGEWLTLPDGKKIWRLRLQAKGAIALMLYYDAFYIPEGGKLFIYNTDRTQVLGAYTTRTNPAGGCFATEFVGGDDLVLEYEPSISGEQADLKISQVGYGYDHLSCSTQLRAGEDDMSCLVNINCEEGESWQNEGKGICRMIMKIGGDTYLCSGSLVNNTAKDLKPYILSAYHCHATNGGVASSEDLAQWVFYFHYETSGCSNLSRPVVAKTMVGCQKRVSIPIEKGSDGLLLELKQQIPADYDVYYNGWDRSHTVPLAGVGIHHPAGLHKKISTYGEMPVTATTWQSSDSKETAAQGAHWNIIFDRTVNGHSVTAGGSSGSPVFNTERLIVGTLSGANSSCQNLNGINLYGKMDRHWDAYGKADYQRMDNWLDPLHTGVMRMAGMSPNGESAPISFLKKTEETTATLLSSGHVQLQWKTPVYQQRISWSEGLVYYRIGMSGSPFYVGQRWTSADLKKIHKKTITAVDFYVESAVDYALYIKQGDRVYEQNVTAADVVVSNTTNRISLKTPFVVDASLDLIVGLHVKKYAKTVYPVYCDQGPKIEGRGLLQSTDGSTWTETKNDFNMLIAAIVSSQEGALSGVRAVAAPLSIQPASTAFCVQQVQSRLTTLEGDEISAFPEITGYNIYRDHFKLASVHPDVLSYTDQKPLAGSHLYQLTIQYSEGESEPTDVLVETSVGIEQIAAEQTGISPQCFDTQVRIANYRQVKLVEIYAADGKLIRKVHSPDEYIATGELPQGIYIFCFHTDQGVFSSRGIKKADL